jgi:predicted amidophosphoribosyltransferase
MMKCPNCMGRMSTDSHSLAYCKHCKTHFKYEKYGKRFMPPDYIWFEEISVEDLLETGGKL